MHDIKALVAELKATHEDGDLYRGQVRDHPALLPSTYRKGIVPGTEGDPMVKVDPAAVLSARGLAQQARSSLMNRLIEDTGKSLGNLLAQQYGLSSESVDVTESPEIAAFFATRRWPTYEHVSDAKEPGVIYRFRKSKRRDPAPPSGDFGKLDLWFEMGQMDELFFDTFLRPDQELGFLDRDKWFGPGQEKMVSTLPLTLSWSEIIALVEHGKKPLRADDQWTRRFRSLNWRTTRTAAQRGGVILPRYFWQAEIAPKVRTARNQVEQARAYGTWSWDDKDDGFPYPRAVPSNAIKIALVGIENLRLRADCEVYHFRHGSRRVTHFYRTLLWPEPSSDEVYQLLWALGIGVLARYYGTAIPAVDDPEAGLFDRGYRVTHEKQTRSARELDDLARGILEDFREEGRMLRAEDYLLVAKAHWHLQERRSRLRSLVHALRADPRCARAALELSWELTRSGKKHWARRSWELADRLDPESPWLLRDKAMTDLRMGDAVGAGEKLDRALGALNGRSDGPPKYDLLIPRAVAAQLGGDEALASSLLGELRIVGFGKGDLQSEVEHWRRIQVAAARKRSTLDGS